VYGYTYICIYKYGNTRTKTLSLVHKKENSFQEEKLRRKSRLMRWLKGGRCGGGEREGGAYA